MKNSIFFVLILAFIACAVTSCLGSIDSEPSGLAELVLPATPYNYSNVAIPEHLRALENTASDNELTDHGATLGRVLFYEKAMSKNNTIACASCHDQALGFASGKRFDTGFEGLVTTRNSMSIANHRFEDQFFWDCNLDPLETQVLQLSLIHI